MGFFPSGKGRSGKADRAPSIELLHRLECKACPLDKLSNFNPHMAAAGAAQPLIYVLGEAPGAAEDKDGQRHFIGKSGKLLRERIPKQIMPYLRFNNVVRTRPLDNITPEKLEIECCRPSVARDIAASKPKAIIGLGAVALQWATNDSGIAKWRGRRTPVSINGHVCWYYPMLHPNQLVHMGKRGNPKFNLDPTDIGSEDERAFCFDLQRVWDEIEELPEPVIHSRAEAEAHIEIIPCNDKGLARLEELLPWAAQQSVVGVDYETNKLRPYHRTSKILSAAIGTPGKTFAFAMDHRQAKWTKAQRARIEELWNDFLRSQVKKAVHNLAFEMEWSALFYGADVLRASPWEDTFNQAMALDERITGCRSLEFLIQLHFGFNLKSLSPLDRKNLDDEPLENVLLYNGMDAKYHCLLYLTQRDLLAAAGLQKIYEKNLRDIPTLVLTQIKGVPVDLEENRALQIKYEDRIRDCAKTISDDPIMEDFIKLTKRKFNPSSPDDVIIMCRDILESKAGFTDRRDAKRYSTEAAILEQIGDPICLAIIALRKAEKQLSTYILPYSEESEFVYEDDKVHCLISSFGTVSDRTAAEDNNIQNLPKRGEEAKEVRRQIRLKKGLVISIDHGQIQFRGIGMMSRDKNLVKYLWERHDIHGEWAERISRAYPEAVGGKQNFTDKKIMKAFRHTAKNQWVFPLCFGSDLGARASQLKIPENILKPLFNEFWKEYSGVKDWQLDMEADYHKYGYVKHLSGRLNRAPLSFNQMINYPIQGLERQIVMDGMNRLSEREDPIYQANLEIHDDLTWLFGERDLEKIKIDDFVENAVTDMLETAKVFDFINCPLTVEVSFGENLMEMEEVLVASSDTWRRAA